MEKAGLPHKKDIAGQIVDCLRQNGGKAVIKGCDFAKKSSCCQPAVSYSLGRLISCGIVSKNQNSKKEYALVPEFMTSDNWRQILNPNGSNGCNARYSAKASVQKRTSADDLKTKLAIAQELVQVYQTLKEAQDQVLCLQAENKKLESEKVRLEQKFQECQEELNNERASLRHDANEIAQLELQLRELRADTNSKSRRAIFDHRGVQS